MFLSRLSDVQKELFLDLCIHASMANNEFAQEEKNTIDQYCEEMRIKARYESNEDLETVTKKITEISNPTELRIIVLEISALIISDNVYDDFEKSFLEAFVQSIGISKKELDDVFELLDQLMLIYGDINRFVFKKEE